MVARAQQQSGSPGVSTYAADFQIEVDGQRLSPRTKGDVSEVRVVMDIDNLTSFEFALDNWDPVRVDFKYLDTSTFAVGGEVHVKLGYVDQLKSLVRGPITTLMPRYPHTGPATLRVCGLDGLLRLRDRKPVAGEAKQFLEMADWEIAQRIADRNGLPIRVTREGERRSVVVQKNQDDAQFLMERARRIDFDCYVYTDPDSGAATLSFTKPADGRGSDAAQTFVFEWGRDLVSFAPTLTAARQVASVTVRGWDPKNKQAISKTARKGDLPGSGGKSGPQLVEEKLRGKQEVVVDAPVLSEQEAQDLATALLRERAYDFITATGVVVGNPAIRPGTNVELRGVSARFGGRYYVKRVEHALTSSNFYTQFEARRVFDGGTGS
jgi:phage protein D